MRAEPSALDRSVVDVAVVGGGIAGATVALEAARRDARVALFERDDFARGSSTRTWRWGCGVEAVLRGDRRVARRGVSVRERLLREVPHLFRPLPILVAGEAGSPLVRHFARHASSVRRSTLPPTESCDRTRCARLRPDWGDDRAGLLAWDARIDDRRWLLSVLSTAHGAGAVLCSHTELVGVRDGCLQLRDLWTDRDVTVRADEVIVAAGASGDDVRRRLGLAGPDFLTSVHTVGSWRSAPTEGECALVSASSDGAWSFSVPHDDCVSSGVIREGRGVRGEPAFDGEFASREGARIPVRMRVASRRPGAPGSERGPTGTVRTVVADELPFDSAVALRVLEAERRPPARAGVRIAGAGPPHEVLDPLWWRHGNRCALIRAELGPRADDLSLWQPIAEGLDVLRAEVVWAVEREGALTFDDVVLGRFGPGVADRLDTTALRSVHELFATVAESACVRSFDADCAALAAGLGDLAR